MPKIVDRTICLKANLTNSRDLLKPLVSGFSEEMDRGRWIEDKLVSTSSLL